MTKVADTCGLYTGKEKRCVFEQIMQNHDNMVSRLCYGYARTKEEFEDLIQDTYANIWQGLDNFRGDASSKTWVYRVTLNTCVSTIRKRTKEGYAMELSTVADISDESQDGLRRINDLYASIGLLSPIDRAVVMLWLDELTYEDIAETIGISRNAVATRLHRAKQKLRTTI